MDTSVHPTAASDTEDRREHPRVNKVELAVCFNDEVYVTSNWSMGGFLLTDYSGSLAVGALVTVVGLGRSPETLRPVNLSARVVRSSGRGIAINYLGLDIEGYTFLQEILRESENTRLLS